MTNRKTIILALAAVVSLGTAAFSSPGAAADNYAAIAYSTESGAVGWANDYPSRRGAEREALEKCGSGCSVVTWFRNACGALATGQNNGYGAGWASDRRGAVGVAMNACKDAASNCSVNQWVCTTR
jgi:hypothetical protein